MPIATGETYTGGTYRLAHVATIGVHSIQFGYWNGLNGSGVETANPYSLTVTAGLELPSGATPFPATFGGNNSVVIPPNAWAWTDPIEVDIPAGTTFYERSFVQTPSQSQGFGVGNLGNDTGSYGDSTNQTTGASPVDYTKTATSLGAPGASDWMFGASSIIGIPFLSSGSVRPKIASVGIIGDSISSGLFDNPPTLGYWLRALNGNFPYTQVAMSGDAAVYWAANSGRHRGLPLKYCNNFVCAEGRNDVTGSATLASIQANLILIWQYCQNRGAATIFQTTITPSATSSDNWTTLINQTPISNNSKRVALNDWLRAGAPMLAGVAVTAGTSGAVTCAYWNASGLVSTGTGGHPLTAVWEIANIVESAQDSGLWAVPSNARTVTDAAITSGSGVVTSNSANFTAADVGTGISIAGAGSSGATLKASILSVTNSTTAVLGAMSIGWRITASTTVSGAVAQIGSPTLDGLHPCCANYIAMTAGVHTSQFVAT
jgi:hypothetical protein